MRRMVAGLANGTLKPVVGREFPLAERREGAGRRDGARRARKNRSRSVKGSSSMAEPIDWPTRRPPRRRGPPRPGGRWRPCSSWRRHDAVLLRRVALVRLARLRRRLLEDAQPPGRGVRRLRRHHVRRPLRRVSRAEAAAPRRARRAGRSSSTASRRACPSNRCCASSRWALALVHRRRSPASG